ncbi:prefoldin subunit [Thermococcus sp.]|uniref:prefoldin subunit n=1 Tax=Thermococcus sp. TaxID=35749 RepID=UPI00260E0DC8|nr:prefoldin subunit [Thermococcus sp.]
MEAVKAYELETELARIRELRKTVELKLGELDYAEGVITASKADRRIYRAFSDLLVEISKGEAIEHIERMRLAYRREIERLRKREKEIIEELAKLKTFHS